MYLLGHLIKFFYWLIYLIKESSIIVKHFFKRRKNLLLSVVVIPQKKNVFTRAFISCSTSFMFHYRQIKLFWALCKSLRMALYFLDKARTAARLCVNVTLLLGIVGWSLISLRYSAEIYDVM